MSENYGADNIQILEGLEAVRKRPGMYIGSTSSRGLHHLVYEIVDNSVDEALAGYCTEIRVFINEDNSITVIDNGRGIPVGINHKAGIPAVEVVFTILHAGGKFGGQGYKISGGLHGVGASVVNALSEWMEVVNCNEGKKYTERFEKGHVTRAFRCEGDTTEHGLYVRFKPDATIFETVEFDHDVVRTRLREQAFLNAGVKLRLIDEREETPEEEDFCYEGGIASFVSYLNAQKHCALVHPDVIWVKGSKGDMTAEIAIQYNDSYNETVVTFANNMSTVEGGTHETGFRLALTNALNTYARKWKFLKDKDKNLSGEDVREGICAVISVKLPDAQFESQTKAKLGNSEVRTFVNNLLSAKLEEYLEENPSVPAAACPVLWLPVPSRTSVTAA